LGKVVDIDKEKKRAENRALWNSKENRKEGARHAIYYFDLGSRDRDVVLVRRTISSGKPEGVGNLEWGGDGEGEVSLRATWGQGGRDCITPKEGFQVSKREMEGGITKN
jgi:hypothetical protein